MDRPEFVDMDSLLAPIDQAAKSVIAGQGFALLNGNEHPGTGLSIRVNQIYPFRGEELELHVLYDDPHFQEQNSWLRGLDQALDMLGQDMVIVGTCRYSHNSGGSYDFKVLAVPKGSQLPEKSQYYHQEPFDKEVNWMGGMDSNSEETVHLPKGSLIWNGKKWWPTTRIKYYY
ncbi:MAG: hypothetical protein A3D48_04155 [Candidatus Yanofskybacteria bacterium RIFCSPHIGHO2_02_FULL_43_17]|uniref:Uncharacterized protein n=1 Tax=Candidatus Staskawiczbacteria bacterium RIFCSPHIGHO2_12_FULL_38_11 TaxID=1802209 RepID=A0A1G2I7D9_9BACT|nr:MAG: hypothetical protein A3D48_04155 [Candidatus Yanofskybacteria bacterium RIFCSPHIGHO2_02_FULL_43_17]OGZ70703.1 MAG: hypothetical protein A3F47_01850 [Candidatus Staskawiczbacteria bacterium RIFCSPHIGHO2_12_FULL_38_11]